ncbi:ABC transporter permease [Pseudonocardia sp. TRM90224]|uniref:ABC transporter permease n=1 Tax=Pseudonocardia sp. TRM90224 TaxID=2812678 RepID=UPI001E2F262C|nr:ABC transporter permease [Pseudonocardia sp. TRM90224]
MGKFILRRVGQAVIVVLAAILLVYVATYALGDPFASTGDRQVPPEIAAQNRAIFGLDQPLPIQYINYIGNLVTGDLGLDFDQRRPVIDMLGAVVPNTARLALVAILIDVAIGVIAGIIAAVKRYSFADVLVTVVSTVAIGVPTFVIGLGLLAFLSGVGPFPVVPRSFTDQVPWYQEVLLPAFALAIIDAAFVARLMRGSMLEVLRADYIRTARAKGVSERRVIGVHALRNSIIPVVTYVGVSLGTLLGGAIITEAIFQYDGVGYLLFRAIGSNNAPVISAVIVFGVIAYTVLSLIVDILYAFLDPRIRLN